MDENDPAEQNGEEYADASKCRWNFQLSHTGQYAQSYRKWNTRIFIVSNHTITIPFGISILDFCEREATRE